MKRSLALIGSVVLVGLTLGACSREAQQGRGGRSGPPALRVRVKQAVAKDVVYRIQALGSLETDDLVQITAEVDGAVSEVRFREGDRVTPETILLRIDPDRFRLEAQRAEAAHRRAVADFNRAQADLKRREELSADQLLSAEELNRSRQESERLAADVAAAKAALDIALQNQRRADVRSPQAGVINSRAVNTGQYVKIGTVLATVVDASHLVLRFKVSEAESLRARKGQTVSFRIAAMGTHAFEARIFHVGDLADPATRQVEVLAAVKNPGPLKPGFFAEVTLATETHAGAIVAPESAVQASERGFVVYVVVEGRALLRVVSTGMRGGGEIEIVDGLKAGEAVVVEGSDRLADGLAVETADAPPQAGGKPQGKDR